MMMMMMMTRMIIKNLVISLKNISLEIDYNKHTAKELKSICKEKGLS